MFLTVRTKPATACLLFSCLAAAFTAGPTFASETQDPLTKMLCEDVKIPFFRQIKQKDGAVRYTPARPGAIDELNSFILPKPPGVKYIFLIGESNAATLARPGPGGKETAVAELAGALGHPARTINCGMGAYNSERTYGVMKEVVRYSPDAIVVMVGNSENCDYCPGSARRWKERLYMAMNRLFWRLSATEIRKKFLLDEQARFFGKMARLARNNKIPLVFCTLPSNLADFPPWGVLPLDDIDFARGWEFFTGGNYPAAKLMFEKHISNDPKDAMGLYYLGQSLLKLKDPDGARRALAGAADHDPRDNRCSGERNAMIRRTARETGALLADIEEWFNSAAPGGVPGGGMFEDKTHWSPNLDGLAACAIMDPLAGTGGPFFYPGGPVRGTSFCKTAAGAAALPPPAGEKDHKKKVLAKYLAFETDMISFHSSDWRVTEELVTFMQRIRKLDPAYLLKISDSPDSLAAATRDYDGQERVPLERIKRFWPYYQAHLGEMYRRRGEPALAVRYFDKALASRPRFNDAYFFRGMAYLKTGQLGKSVADLARSGGPGTRAENMAEIYHFMEKLKNILDPRGLRKDREIPAGRAGRENRYYVYGGTEALTGTGGFYPMAHGYALLGSAAAGSSKLFYGAYPRYAIAVYDGVTVKVDALRLSNGSFYSGPFSDSNVTDWANANGAPDGIYAVIGAGTGGRKGAGAGYLLASPGPGSSGIKVYTLP